MDQELKALEDNETWELTFLPKDKRVVRCKWVYKLKYKTTRKTKKYKVGLGAKGYTQIEEEDFNETFVPMVKMTIIRCLLSIAIAKGWELHQMDVSNAFLHEELDREVYMEVPQGSSNEAEYHVMAHATRDVQILKCLQELLLSIA
ncbi:hypothetical protein CR513_57579, partial [Mucuna pruriens]